MSRRKRNILWNFCRINGYAKCNHIKIHMGEYIQNISFEIYFHKGFYPGVITPNEWMSTFLWKKFWIVRRAGQNRLAEAISNDLRERVSKLAKKFMAFALNNWLMLPYWFATNAFIIHHTSESLNSLFCSYEVTIFWINASDASVNRISESFGLLHNSGDAISYL